MGCYDGAETPAKQFALVSYIPDPLGNFLDQLRIELVPSCSPNAHITVLPPRPIRSSEAQAAEELLAIAEEFSDFEVELGGVEVFPVSKVVFVGLKRGEAELREMYRQLNRGAVAFREPFPYHPHVTLAQKFPVEDLDRLYSLAARRWDEYHYTRKFSVGCLDFVKNLYGNKWIDLASVHLNKTHVHTPA
jgi:2'-5' RNA ligase